MPTQAELNAYAAEVTAKVLSDGDPELFGGPGYAITLAQGDVTPLNLGSLTDANGNVFTLLSEPGQSLTPEGHQWYGGVAENNQILWDGYTVALRLVNGDVWAEEAKFGGWQDISVPADIGHRQGDPGSTPAPPEPPVNTAPTIADVLATDAAPMTFTDTSLVPEPRHFGHHNFEAYHHDAARIVWEHRHG